MKSEHTKKMTPEELADLQKQVGEMTEEELREFRNSFDPDKMGFSGEEGSLEAEEGEEEETNECD